MSLATDGFLLFDDETMLTSYGTGQDRKSTTAFLENKQLLQIKGNGWKKFEIPTYQVTKNTLLEFSFRTPVSGEIYGIGIDNDNNISSNQIFQLYGSQAYGVQDFANYATSFGSWKRYSISVGEYFTGNIKYLTFINDQDISNPTAESAFFKIYLFEKLVLRHDNLSATEDTPLTILSSQLLSNDLGTSLRVTGVDSAYGGTVALSNGNVLFNPAANFYGGAGFKYTVTDRNGKKASANVKVSVNRFNDAPVAVNDSLTTNQGVALSVPFAQLLSNDSDLDGDLLTLTGVNQAVNGTAQLSGTSVVFTPNASFKGSASFNYTVSDGKGGTATATVNVAVNQPSGGTTSSAILGTNLADLVDYSSQLPLVDGFRTSRTWIPHSSTVWDTGERSLLNLDADGWVKSLPAPEDAPAYTDVGTVLYREIQGKYKSGKYLVLYDGEGTIEYGFDAKKNTAESRLGRDVLNVTPGGGGIYIRIKATDPNKTGNYIRNIRVVSEANETNYAEQLFNPAFLDKTDAFGAVRYVGWMETNNSTQVQWSDRPTLSDATWTAKGMPVEIMVELANRLDTDPWFCLPHKVTDEYVRNFAQYVKDNLEPGRKVYVEYSNEVWNWQFQQTAWADQQAKANGLSSFLDWYSKRTTEITRIWDQVWGTEKERVIGVMGAQAANSWIGQRELAYAWDTTGKKSHEYYGIDAIAIAPYFGHYLGSPTTASEIESWTKNPDGGLGKLFDELTKGGVYSKSPVGGALQQSYSWMSAYADLATKENLQLLAYEGGQHLVGYTGAENNQAMTNLFIAANRDPRMGEIYKQYLTKWYQLGGDLFMNFSDVGFPTKWGSWGNLEYLEQNGSPKYDAVMDMIKSLTTPTN